MKNDFLYKMHNKYPKFKLNELKWGFEISECWNYIIEEVCDKLSNYSVKIVQVKQKMGDLVIYIDKNEEMNNNDKEEINKIIEDAVKKAESTCENCGSINKTVSLRNENFIENLCDKCYGSDNNKIKRDHSYFYNDKKNISVKLINFKDN